MKELYIDEYERLVMEGIDAGMTEEEAEAYAERGAYGAMRDRLADMADYYRQRAKDEQL